MWCAMPAATQQNKIGWQQAHLAAHDLHSYCLYRRNGCLGQSTCAAARHQREPYHTGAGMLVVHMDHSAPAVTGTARVQVQCAR